MRRGYFVPWCQIYALVLDYKVILPKVRHWKFLDGGFFIAFIKSQYNV
jgi:hypothetical protein